MQTHVRQFLAAIRLLVVLTVVLGIGYPLLVTVIGRVEFAHQADGSLVRQDGRVVGSRLIGQEFEGAGWFQPRPSAAGTGYDGLASAGTNLGPNSAQLLADIRDRQAAIERADGARPGGVPADAVTASGSGLDPDISPAYAYLQAGRVAQERGLSVDAVRSLVAAHVSGRIAGIFGEPRVNVLELNLALVRLADAGAGGRSGR